MDGFSEDAQRKRASAEWIIEASGGQPLANFGSVTFDTCSATVGNTTASIGSPAFTVSPANRIEITMVASDTTVMSQPADISPDETSFTDTWKSVGP